MSKPNKGAETTTTPVPFTKGAIAEMVAAVPATAKRSGKGNGIAECSAAVIRWLGGSGSASVVAALLDPKQGSARPIIDAMVTKAAPPATEGETTEARANILAATETALLADLNVSRLFTSKGSPPAGQVSKAIWVQATGQQRGSATVKTWVSENADKDGLFHLVS